MTDVVGTGVIELVADARKLRAGVDEARRSIRTLGEGQKDISAQASRSIDQYVGRLQVQAATIGKSTRETELFKLATRGASNEQIAAANAALRTVEAHERSIATAARVRTAMFTIASAAGTVATAFVAAQIRQIAFADRLGDISKSTGLAVEDLAGLSLLAKQSGTDVDSLAKAINRMTVNMGEAPEDFQRLGVTAKEPLAALKQISDLFRQIPDLQARNALANKIFGKSWAEVAPILAEGGKRIEAIVERGKKLSGITTEMQQQADKLGDSWAEFTTISSAAAQATLPSLNNIISKIVEARAESGGLGGVMRAAFAGIAENISRTVGLATDLNGISQRMTSIADDILALEALPKSAGTEQRIKALRAEFEELRKKRDELEKIAVAEERAATAATKRASSQGDIRKVENAQRDVLGLINADAQIALLRKIEGERFAMIDKSMAREAEAARARLQSISEVTNVETALAQLELDTIAKRAAADQAAHASAVRIAKDAKDGDEARRAAGIKLYDSLIARSSDYLKVETDARRRILDLDRQVAESVERSRRTIADARISQLPPEEQREATFQQSFDLERRGRTALLTSDFEGLKKLRAEAEATAQAFIRLGEIDSAEKLLEQFDSFTKTAAGVEKFGANSIARAAEESRKRVDQEIGDIAKSIREQMNTALEKGIPIFASLDSIQQMKTTIQDQLSKDKFTISVEAQVTKIVRDGNVFSDVPQFARGGRARPGLAIVGEEGPELIEVRSPAFVYTAAQTRHILAQEAAAGREVPGFAGGGVVDPTGGNVSTSRDPDMVVELRQAGRQPLRLSGPHDRIQQFLDDLSQTAIGT